MQSVNTERTVGSRWRPACQIVGAALTFMLINSCDSAPGVSVPGDSIVIDREVLLQGVESQPTSLAIAPNGGFLITGSPSGSAWAIDTNAKGDVLWRYKEPKAEGTGVMAQSFGGAVPLANGNTLLCGGKLTKTQHGGLLAILDGSGHLVDEQLLVPDTSDTFYLASFYQCKPWGDGIAVVGDANDRYQRFGWLLKLDGNGKKQWEIVDPKISGQFVETRDHSLVFAGESLGDDHSGVYTLMARVDQRGSIIATKLLSTFPTSVMRSAAPGKTIMALTSKRHKDPALLTLDDRFTEVQPQVPTARDFLEQGGGWVLQDGSVALLGKVFASGGIYRAAIEHAGRHHASDELHMFLVPTAQGYSSVGVVDAVPLTGNTFVMVRDQESADMQNNGVVLSWVTFK